MDLGNIQQKLTSYFTHKGYTEGEKKGAWVSHATIVIPIFAGLALLFVTGARALGRRWSNWTTTNTSVAKVALKAIGNVHTTSSILGKDQDKGKQLLKHLGNITDESGLDVLVYEWTGKHYATENQGRFIRKTEDAIYFKGDTQDVETAVQAKDLKNIRISIPMKTLKGDTAELPDGIEWEENEKRLELKLEDCEVNCFVSHNRRYLYISDAQDFHLIMTDLSNPEAHHSVIYCNIKSKHQVQPAEISQFLEKVDGGRLI